MNNLIKEGGVQESCYINGILVFVCEGCPGIYAQTLLREFLWSFEQFVSGRYICNMKCTSVTMDNKGHIFFIDTNHVRIRLFTINGEYKGCLVEQGQHQIRTMKMVKYCKKTSCVVINHQETLYYSSGAIRTVRDHVSVLKVKDADI